MCANMHSEINRPRYNPVRYVSCEKFRKTTRDTEERLMLELEKGTEILVDIGGIDNLDEARALFREKMSEGELAKLEKITTEAALLKIANSIALCQPDSVMINTGDTADRDTIRAMSIEKGEEEKLAMKDHTIHYDLAEEQGRIVDRTFYIVNPDEKISALAKKILRDEGHDYVKTNLSGIMQGKVMLVGFFNRGPAGAPATIPALEITSSTYVMHSANLLYRNSYDTFDQQVESLVVESLQVFQGLRTHDAGLGEIAYRRHVLVVADHADIPKGALVHRGKGGADGRYGVHRIVHVDIEAVVTHRIARLDDLRVNEPQTARLGREALG